MGQSAPLIGITTYGPEGDYQKLSLPVAYLRAVADAGGVPMLLGPTSVDLQTLLDRVDGLILAGGGDLSPATHGSGDHETVYGVVAERDDFEIALARGALVRPQLPVLGICRGMQILNVALGGDLELNIPDRRGDQVEHRLPPRKPTFHGVKIEAGSRLEGIFGCADLEVCSWHHQEVRRLGEGLTAVAHAADGVVEALVSSSHPWCLAVQWHPEMQTDTHPVQRRLFEALVGQAGSR